MRAAAALKKAELSLVLTGDSQIQRLNDSWRNKDKPTDVLSFPLWNAAQLQKIGRLAARAKGRLPAWELGDIVISLDRAAAQAEARGFLLREELDWLLVHGLLHLLGYDHELSPIHEKKMRQLELKALAELGWKKERLQLLRASLGGA